MLQIIRMEEEKKMHKHHPDKPNQNSNTKATK